MSPILRSPPDDPLIETLLREDDLSRLAEPFARGRRTWVGRLARPEGALFVKRYEYPFVPGLLRAPCPSPARCEHRNLRILRERFGNRVRPVGWGEMRKVRLIRAVIVTEAFEGATDLKALLRRLLESDAPPGTRDRLLGLLPDVYRTLRKIHDSGGWLRDALAKNLLVRLSDGAFSWIDLPRARFGRGPLPIGRAADDLAALEKGLVRILGEEDRNRLLAEYACGPPPIDPGPLRRLVDRRRLRREHSTGWGRLVHFGRKRLLKLPVVRRLAEGKRPDRG